MKPSRDILVEFGKRVRQLRKSQQLSQEAFAAKCSLDRTYMGGIERGERNLALRNIRTISKALGVSLSELFQGL
jgi:transcriptional regulator with XRE-family HTH domain